MILLYWLLVGWWLEPVLLIIRILFGLFVGLPLKIMKWAAIFMIALVVCTLFVGSVGVALFLGALTALAVWLSEKRK